MSDLLKDAGYLGDLDTSSSEPHSSGSEDEIAIASKKGIPFSFQTILQILPNQRIRLVRKFPLQTS